MIVSFVAKIQKKRYKTEKSYLELSDRSKNLLSVQNTLEILQDNNHLPNQLLLSPKLGPFEVETIKIW